MKIKMGILGVIASVAMMFGSVGATNPIALSNPTPAIGETVTVDATALICNFPPCRTIITISWTDAFHANHVLATREGAITTWTFGTMPPTVIFLAKSTGSNKAHSFVTAQLSVSASPV